MPEGNQVLHRQNSLHHEARQIQSVQETIKCSSYEESSPSLLKPITEMTPPPKVSRHRNKVEFLSSCVEFSQIDERLKNKGTQD